MLYCSLTVINPGHVQQGEGESQKREQNKTRSRGKHKFQELHISKPPSKVIGKLVTVVSGKREIDGEIDLDAMSLADRERGQNIQKPVQDT